MDANAADLYYSGLMTQTGPFTVQVEPNIFLEMPPIWHQLLSGYQHVLSMFNYCPK